MRLFLSIFPPKEILDNLRDTQRRFSKDKRNLKFIPADQLHITLKFLGADVSEKSKDSIIQCLRGYEGSFHKAQVNMKNAAFGFQRQTFPKVLLVHVEETESLKLLGHEVHEAIKSLQLRDTVKWKEKFSSEFHVSLARLKQTASNSIGQKIKIKAKGLNDLQLGSFVANEFFLMESISDRNTVTYKKLERFKI